MSIKIAIKQFFIGIYHSLYIFIRLFKKNEASPADKFEKNEIDENNDAYISSVQSKIKIYCILNGCIFLSIVCYMDYVILPMLDWCIYKMIPDSYYNLATSLMRTIFKILILYFWSLSIFLFYSLFQYMKFSSNDEKKTSMLSFRFIKNVIIKTIDITTTATFQTILLIESIICSFIPLEWIANMLFHIHFAFFISFMVFDFKWSLKGWNLQEKIDFMESRCMYFLGFGLVLSILFCIPGSLIYNTIMSSFFIPLVVFNGMETQCENLIPSEVRFPIFDFQMSIMKFLNRKSSKSKEVLKKFK